MLKKISIRLINYIVFMSTFILLFSLSLITNKESLSRIFFFGAVFIGLLGNWLDYRIKRKGIGQEKDKNKDRD